MKTHKTLFVVLFILFIPTLIFAQEQLIHTGNGGCVNPKDGTFYAPAGDNIIVNTKNGTVYAPAGDAGYVNTRTGRFVPATPKHDDNQNNRQNNNDPYSYSDEDYDN